MLIHCTFVGKHTFHNGRNCVQYVDEREITSYRIVTDMRASSFEKCFEVTILQYCIGFIPFFITENPVTVRVLQFSSF